ncbi:MAG: hypothetical protein ACRD29_19850 [Acidimicrobiales bacterium]
MQTADEHTLGFAGSSGFVATMGGLVVAGGAALGIVRFMGGTPAEQGLEGALGACALGAVVAAPGGLALLGLARPTLLLPAATVLFPLSFLSFAGLTFPLLVPAVSVAVAYGRRSALEAARPGMTALTTACVLILLVVAVGALFVHEDARTFSTADGGGCTSDVITFAESLISLAVTTAAILGGWFLATPRFRAG